MKRRREKIFLLFVCLYLFLSSCDPVTKKVNPAEGFHWIYDNPTSSNYTAVDIRQTKDEGFMILGMVEQAPYLLKLDKCGNFLWDTGAKPIGNYFDPIPDVLIIDDEYFFFCSWEKKEEKHGNLALLKYNEISKSFVRIKLSRPSLQIPNIVPLAANLLLDKRFLLLVTNTDNDKVFLYNLGADGTSAKREYYSHNNCTEKYSSRDRRCHFIEVIENSENKFYNFQSYLDKMIAAFPDCFRITTINPVDLSFIETSFFRRPYIAMVWHSRQFFSAARVDNNIVTFFINSEVIRPESSEEPYPLQIKENTGEPQLELNESKAVYIKTKDVKEKQIVFFVGSATNNQIILYAYERSTGYLKGKKYFGHMHSYEACGLIETRDGGLAILGTTQLMDYLKRICLFKLSKAEVEELVGS